MIIYKAPHCYAGLLSLTVCSVIMGRYHICCANTDDAYGRPLESYTYEKAGCIHIIGASA
ncbi:MAG: hypothetical protein IKR76_07170 [Ruminococcus sp.]|nr:hypothetical protein [Ruminococcus sp.]